MKLKDALIWVLIIAAGVVLGQYVFLYSPFSIPIP